MPFRNVGWMYFPAAMLLFSLAVACTPPHRTNFSHDPRFWCSVDARVAVSASCDVAVQEIITVPWTTGVLNRFVPTDDSQSITDVSAYRLKGGIRATKLTARQYREKSKNILLSVQVGRLKSSASVLITYKKIGGVQMFSPCSGIGDFMSVESSDANTVMFSSWAFGGRSIPHVRHMAVSFSIKDDQKLKYIDSQSTAPTKFKTTTRTNARNEAGTGIDQVRIAYNGLAVGLTPSKLIFYIRYYMALGAQSCSGLRDCKYEEMIMNEQLSSENKRKIIVWIILGALVILIIGGVTALVLFCKRVKARQVDSDAEEENLPESLRHFERDTGIDETGEKRAEQVWMSDKSTEMKEEFYALDLSPRNRGKNGNEGI